MNKNRKTASYNMKKDGSYLVRIFLGKDVNGKRIYKNVTFVPKAKTPRAVEKEIESFAQDYRKKYEEGELYDADKMTFKVFFDKWLSDYAPKQLTQAVQEQTEQTVNRVFMNKLGSHEITKIRDIHLQPIVNQFEKDGLSPATIKRYFDCLSTVLTTAKRLKLIKENPCRDLILPRIKKDEKIHCMDKHETALFLQALSEPIQIHHPEKIRKNGRKIPAYDEMIVLPLQIQALFTLALFSGARRGEMLALRWSDIDFSAYTIRINKASAKTKTGQITKEPKTRAGYRTFMIDTPAIQILHRWKEAQLQLCADMGSAWEGEPLKRFDDNFIFIQNNGRQMDLNTPTHKIQEFLTYYNSTAPEDEQLPMLRFHDLRHSNATLLIAGGIDIETISKRLGHENVAITLNRYGHALPSQDEKARSVISGMLALNKEKQENINRKIMA